MLIERFLITRVMGEIGFAHKDLVHRIGTEIDWLGLGILFGGLFDGLFVSLVLGHLVVEVLHQDEGCESS